MTAYGVFLETLDFVGELCYDYESLIRWAAEVSSKAFSELKQHFRSADYVDGFVVFIETMGEDFRRRVRVDWLIGFR